jgi:hypothetical protein
MGIADFDMDSNVSYEFKRSFPSRNQFFPGKSPKDVNLLRKEISTGADVYTISPS